ncbi:hypothetical protein UlMin_006231 [Ulmus minor]
MDTNLQSPPRDNADVKAAFRKPSTDAVNRKYRRHSPVSRSSSSDGSPKHDRSSSPKLSGEDPGKVSGHLTRKDDGREIERDLDRRNHGRSRDSHRQFSRSSHGYSRYDDHNRHDKHADEVERGYHKLSSHSGRESRGGAHSDRSRDHLQNEDKYARDKYDGSGNYHKYRERGSSFDRAGSGRRHTHSEDTERDRIILDKDGQDDKRGYRKNTGDCSGDRKLPHDESRGHQIDLLSRRDDSRHRAKESFRSELKETNDQNTSRFVREPTEQSEDKCAFGSDNKESPGKRQKLLSMEKDADIGKRVSKFSAVPDVKESGSKQHLDGNDSEFANDLNAAKVAAMKAAEMVNKNLVGGVGTGFMTTDQKKKLLWGNKKTTKAEESGHRWDAALFTDRERQEKFKKLMGVKGEQKAEDHNPENQGSTDPLQAEKQREQLQLDLEKQYTAGLRRRDGRTVGLGL